MRLFQKYFKVPHSHLKILRSTCSRLCRLNTCVDKGLAFYLRRFYCSFLTVSTSIALFHINSGNVNVQVTFNFTALLQDCVCEPVQLTHTHTQSTHTKRGQRDSADSIKSWGENVFFKKLLRRDLFLSKNPTPYHNMNFALGSKIIPESSWTVRYGTPLPMSLKGSSGNCK